MARLRSTVLILAAALALAACAAGGPMDPPGPQAARGAAPGQSLADLRVSRWPAQGRERAIILALHGFGDAGDLTYDAAARYWAGRGITTVAPDLRGFGGNPSRKRWPGAEALAADAQALARELRARNPGVPIVVVGHSMGGGVALAAAARGIDAEALVLAAPAIAGGDALNPAVRGAAWAMAAAAPDRRWTGGEVVEIWPTDNIAALRRTAEDTRVISDPSSRELYGLIQVMDAARAGAPRVTLPTLTLMGANDQLLDPATIRAVHDTAPGAVDFRLYPEGWHWLFRDLQAEGVWRDVADFALAIERRGPIRAAASPPEAPTRRGGTNGSPRGP